MVCIYCVYMPLWHQLMNRKPLFSISENYSHHCQTTLSWSKYYSLVSIGVNRSESLTCSVDYLLQYIQWNLCNLTPVFSDILWHSTKMYSTKVFLWTKIKREYSDILYNATHFSGLFVCWIRQVPLYVVSICQFCNSITIFF